MEVEVPCGRCWGCRLERSRQWAIRCVHESYMHKENSFVTLTYRDEDLTWGHSRPTLVKQDLQKFFKRLRKKYGKLRFFACGEYGGRTHRPHYHACIFGIDFPDKKFHHEENGIQNYVSDSLDSIWSHGHCLVGDVTFESAAYVARYIMDKKLGNTSGYYQKEGIEAEFIRMSRRPGIGKPWFDRWHADIFPNDQVIIRGGVKCVPPKYYNSLYELLEPERYQRIKAKRDKNLKEREIDRSLYKLNIREKVKLAQIKNLTREKN